MSVPFGVLAVLCRSNPFEISFFILFLLSYCCNLLSSVGGVLHGHQDLVSIRRMLPSSVLLESIVSIAPSSRPCPSHNQRLLLQKGMLGFLFIRRCRFVLGMLQYLHYYKVFLWPYSFTYCNHDDDSGHWKASTTAPCAMSSNGRLSCSRTTLNRNQCNV